VDGYCCDQLCDAACDVCAWDLGASEDGACTPAPFTSDASEACAPQTCDGVGVDCVELCVDEPATPAHRPADFIFVVDNSGSMGEETQGLEDNINTSFANVVASLGLDYTVNMVTNHGTSSTSVCVSPPLSGTVDCAAAAVEIPGQFGHYDVDVQSHDGLCVLLDTFSGSNAGGEADEWGLFPDGWGPWLRTEALKVFVVLTDDGTSCTWDGNTFNDGNTVIDGQAVAVAWDEQLLALSPAQFGTVAERNYVLHGMLAVQAAIPAIPTEPHLPSDPVVTAECAPGGVDPGTGYQWLAKGTGGLRFGLCDPSIYDTIFEQLAAHTHAQTLLECQYAVPSPVGQSVDPDRLRMVFTPPAAEASVYTPVATAADCGAATTAFYVFEETLHLCPETCAEVEAEPQATLDVQALCE